VTAAFVEHDKSGINIAFQSGSVLTSPASVAAAGPLTVSETSSSAPEMTQAWPAQRWDIQRDGAPMSAADYAQNYWDEFADLDE
jgi:hypothetical protein